MPNTSITSPPGHNEAGINCPSNVAIHQPQSFNLEYRPQFKTRIRNCTLKKTERESAFDFFHPVTKGRPSNPTAPSSTPHSTRIPNDDNNRTPSRLPLTRELPLPQVHQQPRLLTRHYHLLRPPLAPTAIVSLPHTSQNTKHLLPLLSSPLPPPPTNTNIQQPESEPELENSNSHSHLPRSRSRAWRHGSETSQIQIHVTIRCAGHENKKNSKRDKSKSGEEA